MIRRHGTLLRATLACGDALAILALMYIVSGIWRGAEWHAEWAGIVEQPLWPALLAAGAWVGVLWGHGLYQLRARWSLRGELLAMGRATLTMVLVVIAALYLLNWPEVSRAFVLLVVPSAAVVSLASRRVIHWFLGDLRRRGRNTRNLLIVGTDPIALRLAHELEAHPALGVRIIGYLNGTSQEPGMGWPYLGAIGGLARVLRDHVVDEVAVCLGGTESATTEEIVELCRAEGKVVRIPLAADHVSGTVRYVESLAGLPVMSIVQGPDRQIALAVKRVLDFVGASFALMLLSPLLVALGAAILVSQGRPILFRQDRVGLHGRRFRLVKFRTMIPDAEQKLAELRARNEIKGHAFKLTDDPRVTRLGRFLRRTSLDELPQLWNVLLGEMSLVGPRPPVPAEVDEYDQWHRRRLSMKPGITGLWQVSARRESEFDRWVEKDLEYIDRWSLWLDFKIFLRTLPAMVRSEGR